MAAFAERWGRRCLFTTPSRDRVLSSAPAPRALWGCVGHCAPPAPRSYLPNDCVVGRWPATAARLRLLAEETHGCLSAAHLRDMVKASGKEWLLNALALCCWCSLHPLARLAVQQIAAIRLQQQEYRGRRPPSVKPPAAPAAGAAGGGGLAGGGGRLSRGGVGVTAGGGGSAKKIVRQASA